MCSPCKRHHGVPLAETQQALRKIQRLRLQCKKFRLYVQPYIHRHLIVARAACVDLLAEISKFFREAAFHRHVHILVCLENGERPLLELLQHFAKCFLHQFRFVSRYYRRDERHFRKHLHVRGSA